MAKIYIGYVPYRKQTLEERKSTYRGIIVGIILGSIFLPLAFLFNQKHSLELREFLLVVPLISFLPWTSLNVREWVFVLCSLGYLCGVTCLVFYVEALVNDLVRSEGSLVRVQYDSHPGRYLRPISSSDAQVGSVTLSEEF